MKIVHVRKIENCDCYKKNILKRYYGDLVRTILLSLHLSITLLSSKQRLTNEKEKEAR